MRAYTALAALAAAVLVIVSPSQAQISPGPLAKAHEELEGVTNCLKCHGIGQRVLDARCLECHREIAWLQEQERGLHGRESTECTRCHLEHGGRDFELIHWDEGGPDAFDHLRAGWVLDGKHAEATCRKCHQPELHAGPLPAIAEGGLSAHSWLGLERTCVTCHADPHESRLGTSCADCHTTKGWKTILRTFDHDATQYPLRGAHVEVKCASCHKDGYEKAALPAFQTCNACHRDPHDGKSTLQGQSVDCASCHRVEAFRPSTYRVADHRESAYPLEGKHAQVACEECHDKGAQRNADGVAVSASFRFRMKFERCVDCHDDAHGEQLAKRPDGGACETCHGLDELRPSLFDLAAHQELRFPLEGAHQQVTCRDCHGPERPLLPAVATADVLGSARVLFHWESLECTECHRDPHEGRFSTGGERSAKDGCVTCHDHASFRASKVDVIAHRAYEFPLDGAHAAVPCFECHKELVRDPGSSLLSAPATHMTFKSKARACVDCHDDPHGAQFTVRDDAGACKVCHGAERFVPATLFDHDEDARFPLEGAHARVACEKCHPVGARTDGTEGIIYRPIEPHRCQDCHAEPPPPLRAESP